MFSAIKIFLLISARDLNLNKAEDMLRNVSTYFNVFIFFTLNFSKENLRIMYPYVIMHCKHNGSEKHSGILSIYIQIAF